MCWNGGAVSSGSGGWGGRGAAKQVPPGETGRPQGQVGSRWRRVARPGGPLGRGPPPAPPFPDPLPTSPLFVPLPPQDAKFGLCNLSSLLSSAPAPETHITSPPLPCTGHPKRRDRAGGRRSARPPTFSPVHLLPSSHWLWEQCCQLWGLEKFLSLDSSRSPIV